MSAEPSKLSSFVDWFLRDRRDGRIVIGQWPNLPLILFAAAAASAWLLGQAAPEWPRLIAASRIAAGVFLAWWAADEVLRGVNPWRRCLGAAVLAYLVWQVWANAAGS